MEKFIRVGVILGSIVDSRMCPSCIRSFGFKFSKVQVISHSEWLAEIQPCWIDVAKVIFAHRYVIASPCNGTHVLSTNIIGCHFGASF